MDHVYIHLHEIRLPNFMTNCEAVAGFLCCSAAAQRAWLSLTARDSAALCWHFCVCGSASVLGLEDLGSRLWKIMGFTVYWAKDLSFKIFGLKSDSGEENGIYHMT